VQTSTGAAVYENSVVYVLVHTLLAIYLAVFLVVGTLVFKANDTKPFLDTIAAIPKSVLSLCLTLWLGFRLYLLSKYGLASFNLLAVRELTDASYVDIGINTLLWYIALGSFLSFVIKASLDLRTLWNLFLVVLSSAFFIFAVVFNEMGSARRFLIQLLFLVTLVLLSKQQRLLPQPKTILTTMLFALMLFGLAEYFQQIRENHLNLPEIIPLMNQGEFIEAAVLYLTPTLESENALATLDNIQIRFGPFQVLYEITVRQVDRWAMTYGAVVIQSVLNVTPSLAVTNKEYVNADHIIAEAFDLEDVDLPTGILASLQSDFSFFGFLVAPLVIALLLRLYGKGINKTDNHILQIVFLSAAGLTASYVEEVPDAIFTNAREVCVFITIVFVFRKLASLARLGQMNAVRA
jgi:hypothetical protein